jgi:hypothetical protein
MTLRVNSNNSSPLGFLLQASSHAKKSFAVGLMYLDHNVFSRTSQRPVQHFSVFKVALRFPPHNAKRPWLPEASDTMVFDPDRMYNRVGE